VGSTFSVAAFFVRFGGGDGERSGDAARFLVAFGAGFALDAGFLDVAL
jgi:hypothetical protein